MIIEVFKNEEGALFMYEKDSTGSTLFKRNYKDIPIVAEFETKEVKKKVKKTLEGWVNIYPFYNEAYIYESQEKADIHHMDGRIACVKTCIEYEVEE